MKPAKLKIPNFLFSARDYNTKVYFWVKFFYRSLIFNVIQHETVLELNAMKK